MSNHDLNYDSDGTYLGRKIISESRNKAIENSLYRYIPIDLPKFINEEEFINLVKSDKTMIGIIDGFIDIELNLEEFLINNVKVGTFYGAILDDGVCVAKVKMLNKDMYSAYEGKDVILKPVIKTSSITSKRILHKLYIGLDN